MAKLRPANRETADFGRAVDADAFVAGDPAADMHRRGADRKRPRSIEHAIFAWRDNRADDREHDLAAVIVAGEN